MKKYISILIFLCIGTTLSLAQKGLELKFDSKGEFKVAQFTDIHWDEKANNCKETVEIINNVLATEKPDVAILTGDIICYKPAKAGWLSIAKIFADAKTPWAVLMGNHDAEQDMSREEIYALLKQQPYYIGDIGPKEIHGTGNFVLPVQASTSNKTAATLYCLDSNEYTDNQLQLGRYDWIRMNQIAWYRNNSTAYTQANGGTPLPSLAFFHIPLIEYEELIKSETYYGEKRENGASTPDINSGFFSSVLEMGDVMGTFVGHDHDNSFIGMKNDIALAYGRVSGLNAYGKLERGARIIQMKENKMQFDTWIRTNKGTSELYFYPSGITQEEEQISAYEKASEPKNLKQGVNYKYYEYEGKIKTVHALTDTKISKKIKSGTVSNFSLEPSGSREDFFGFEFTTWLKIPEDGMYKFYTYTDDGSKLYINDKMIVDNDGSHNARRADGRIALKAGYHKVKVLYFESYMGQSIEVGISSRNINEMVIPNDMLFIGK